MPKISHVMAAGFAFGLLAAPGLAAETIQVPAFHAIEVHGGGIVMLRHGAQQKVVLIRGDKNVARIEVRGGTLDLSPCRDRCWGRHELKVEVTAPFIDGLHIHGGGDLTAVGNFPKQPSLNVSVHGGGDGDIRAMMADTVTATVHGGGDLKTKPLGHLRATVHGGGDIDYWGHPQVEAQTHGGGEVTGH